MTRTYDQTSVKEALDALDRKGQVYVHSHEAFEILGSIGEAESNDLDSYELSKSLESKQRPAGQARGIVTVWPHDMIVTASDISAILVEALGHEPSEAGMLGSGSTEDVRHEENLGTIIDALPYDDSEFDEGDEQTEGETTEGEE